MAVVMGTPPSFESTDALLARRSRWLLAAAGSPLLGAIAAAVEGSDAAAHLLAVLGISLIGVVYRMNWRSSLEEVAIRADSAGLVLNDRLMPRSTLRAGLFTSGVAPRVIIRRWFRPAVQLQMESTNEARALLRALDLDVAAHFYGRSWIETHWAYYLGAVLAIAVATYVGSQAGELGRVLAYPLGLIGLVAFLWPTRLRIGADGIDIRWLWVHRFIGYDDLEFVARYEEFVWIGITTVGLHIQTRTRAFRLPMGWRRWLFNLTLWPVEQRVALAREYIDAASLDFRERRAEATAPSAPVAAPEAAPADSEFDEAAPERRNPGRSNEGA